MAAASRLPGAPGPSRPCPPFADRPDPTGAPARAGPYPGAAMINRGSRRLESWIGARGAGIGLLLLAALVPGAAAQGEAAAAPAASTEPVAAEPQKELVPVRLEGQVLFYVRGNMGPFSARERAENAERRLERIVKDPFYSEDLITIRAEGGSALIFYREDLVGVTSQEDAALVGKTPEELASDVVQIAKDAIRRYREGRLPAQRLLSAVYVALSTLALIGLLYALRWGQRRAIAHVEQRRSAGASGLLEKQLGVHAGKLVEMKVRGLRLLRLFVTVLLVLVYLETAFTFLPMTRGFATAMLEYALDPLRSLWEGFLANIGDLITIVVLVAIVRLVLNLLRWLLREAARGTISLPGVAPQWTTALYKILRLVVLAIASVMIYPYIPGSNSAAFKGIGLFAGALFTLGASGAAGNFIGGLSLIFMNAFRVGDRVRVGDITGDVLEATLMVTRLRTPKNEVITLSNSRVLADRVVNYSVMARQAGVILHTTLTIGYDAPWRRVHELLIAAARQTEGVLADPAPFVLQLALNDFSVSYELNAYTREARDMPQIYGRLHQNIQDRFSAGGIEILSPYYAALRDGNPSTLPGARPAASPDSGPTPPAPPG